VVPLAGVTAEAVVALVVPAVAAGPAVFVAGVLSLPHAARIAAIALPAIPPSTIRRLMRRPGVAPVAPVPSVIPVPPLASRLVITLLPRADPRHEISRTALAFRVARYSHLASQYIPECAERDHNRLAGAIHRAINRIFGASEGSPHNIRALCFVRRASCKDDKARESRRDRYWA